ncbi:aromatic ring-opening dioxygenase subunit LigA [Burkholderia cenocepacia]|uniref:Aromatic ring-opening dioxygenase subunit LigA n=1 Tax=Burkholderia cenocepacia TaxID=95486 RepID=A0ABD4U6Q2_9BURK|nr:aromatic ring-opening dioxygenase subunit LigA [Burkholderia cenocepacia]MCW3604723.1 aromatic ring-opening dioxygenase subunit LigA [Burkholderia cenocepacia]MCW3694224.1 aromatic ring-opening dioxygenase subunit LigA [Burkholderia cenocepacia]MCW3702549.1 aromatic ring-opening dioxygenase subunit LigA [Burkholderia cenocepacia]MCW3709819.1 aromatic ring-opening dioxygenase subunit LigA [Burkholderia cenocepacia]MCW3718179.1 aromatic ring-opening dioxygenase subunit LigA [Burkholderia ceno
MSLYYVQKVIYQLDRDPALLSRFREAPDDVLSAYGDRELRDDERAALRDRDLGLLYVMGVNGQLLMHLAAGTGVEWPAYIDALREGVHVHGPVRAGIYAMKEDAS